MVRLSGELDPVAAAVLRGSLAGVGLDDVDSVLVDCGALTFLDSSGIAELVRLQDRAASAGVDFAMVKVAPAQRTVLEITGLVELLNVADG